MSSSSGAAPGCCSPQETMLEEEGRLGQLHPRTTLRSLKLWICRVVWTVRFWSTVDATPDPKFIYFIFFKSPKLPRKHLPSHYVSIPQRNDVVTLLHLSHFCHHAFGKKTVHFLTFLTMFKVFFSLFALLQLPDRCSALKLHALGLLTLQAAPICRSNCLRLMQRVLNDFDSLEGSGASVCVTSGWTGSFPVDHIWLSVKLRLFPISSSDSFHKGLF